MNILRYILSFTVIVSITSLFLYNNQLVAQETKNIRNVKIVYDDKAKHTKIPEYISHAEDAKKRTDATNIDRFISLAKSKVGSPYLYANAGPDRFDCSGFVYYLFLEFKTPIPRTSIDQSKIGDRLEKDEILVGDMLFFDTSNKGHVNHSAIYLGNDKFIHASSGKAKGVVISDMNGWYKDKFMWGIRKSVKDNGR